MRPRNGENSISSIRNLNKKGNQQSIEFEEKLRELTLSAYDDTFPKLLRVNMDSFLRLISKSIKEKYELLYRKTIDFQILQTNEKNIEPFYKEQYNIFLKHWNFYLNNPSSFNFLKHFRKHCPQTTEFALHSCSHNSDQAHLSKLIEISLNQKEITHVICISCQATFSIQDIKLFCFNCKTHYHSASLNEKENVNLLPATWDTYHCKRQLKEKMKCIKCFHVLYINLKSLKLHCINPRCNFNGDPMSIIWKCSICHIEFQSKATIYNPLHETRIKKAIRTAIFHQQKARPNINCPCGMDQDMKGRISYYHSYICNGQLYDGIFNKQRIIVCEKCKVLYSYETFEWTCPLCQDVFSIQSIQNQLKEGNSPNKEKRSTSQQKNNHKSPKHVRYFEEEDNQLSEEPNFSRTTKKRSSKQCILSLLDKESIEEIDNQISEFTFFNIKQESEDCEIENKDQFPMNIQSEIIANAEVLIKIAVPSFNLDDYEIIDKIGQGAYATIFEVEHYKTKQRFAMKKTLANDINDLEKCKTEYELMYVHPHPNIVKVYNVIIQKLDFTTYVVYAITELGECDWDSQIENLNQSNQKCDEKELKGILLQLTNALAFLQTKSITHRDIKPQNILVFPNKVYKLNDFGEAKYVRKAKDMNTLKGTEMFMSPPVLKALYHNEKKTMHNSYKSDIFSLGLCFLYAFTLDSSVINNIRKETDYNKIIKDFNISPFFSTILSNMLATNEIDRHDCISLEEYLTHHKDA